MCQLSSPSIEAKKIEIIILDHININNHYHLYQMKAEAVAAYIEEKYPKYAKSGDTYTYDVYPRVQVEIVDPSCPYVPVRYVAPGYTWTISDTMIRGIENIKDRRSIGGGGNSSWYLAPNENNNDWTLEVDISGSGGDVTIRTQVENEYIEHIAAAVIEARQIAEDIQAFMDSIDSNE